MEIGDRRRRAALVEHLMEAASALCRIAHVERRRDHQNPAGIGPRLAHGGQYVENTRAGDRKAHAGFAGGSGIAVGHEARTLFVTDQNMLDLRARQGPVHFDVVDARNAENGVDTIGFEQADEGFAG